MTFPPGFKATSSWAPGTRFRLNTGLTSGKESSYYVDITNPIRSDATDDEASDSPSTCNVEDGSFRFPGGVKPTLSISANAVDVLDCVAETSEILHCAFLGNLK